MFRLFVFLFAAAATLSAQAPPVQFSDDVKIAVQNAILAKVNGTTISMMDVKKKMDLLFYQNYPQMANSAQARCQFYESSWRHVLMEMIDQQLILADATEKEIKLSDGEIREEIETRFGPNVMLTLDKIGLAYDETWKMVKEELIVQRMNWWFIHSKAMRQVTPQDIRQAFRLYQQEHPAYQEFTYRVVSIRGNNAEEIAEKAYQLLTQSRQSPEAVAQSLQSLDESIAVSQEYVAADYNLSDVHKTALFALNSGEYGSPVIQKSTQKGQSTGQSVAKIFYLKEKEDHPAASFHPLSQTLRNELVSKASQQQSLAYLEKLRKHYGFDATHLQETLPADLHPFSFQ